MEGGREDGKEGGRGEGADTELKTKTPHVNAGKKQTKSKKTKPNLEKKTKNKSIRTAQKKKQNKDQRQKTKPIAKRNKPNIHLYAAVFFYSVDPC